MNPLVLILLSAMLLGMLVLMAFYYNKLIIRFISIFNNKSKSDYSKKMNNIFRLLSLLIAGCTIVVFNIVGITLMHYFFICLAIETINKLICIIIKNKELKIWTLLYKSTAIPFLIAIGIVIYGYINIHNIVRTSYTIQTDKLSTDYKIILITDVHYGTVLDKDDMENICHKISKENADLIILCGDIVDERTTADQMHEVIETLSTLQSKDGIYLVNGNHDLQQYSSDKALSDTEYLTLVDENGINYIEDDVVDINEEITLIGRQDYSYSDRADINTLMKNIDKDKYIICADHQPVKYKDSSDAGVDLNVSGHTHAGQIYPVGYFIKYAMTADLYYGIKDVNGMTGIVSSGMCGWGFPVRTQEHCEYVVINLEALK
ncbi:MAG: metallophosphoesterase [Lachnospiraceae bacterium]|nr:metallophosphoesterase [Lachnospiraceae bacterium]